MLRGKNGAIFNLTTKVINIQVVGNRKLTSAAYKRLPNYIREKTLNNYTAVLLQKHLVTRDVEY